MSFLRELQARAQSQLRPTATRVTNASGQTYHERRSEDGTFEASDKSSGTDGLFMVVDRSPDEKLHHVIDGVYIGSQDAASNVPSLDECKITHIVNVATGIANAFPTKYEYLNIALLDVPETNIREVFSRTNAFIQQALANHGCVLVHCNAGISRSASIILAYLLGIQDMNYEDAYRLLKTARSNIRPNDGFVRQLKEYAAEIAQMKQANLS